MLQFDNDDNWPTINDYFPDEFYINPSKYSLRKLKKGGKVETPSENLNRRLVKTEAKRT